jgi:hypothetical protein
MGSVGNACNYLLIIPQSFWKYYVDAVQGAVPSFIAVRPSDLLIKRRNVLRLPQAFMARSRTCLVPLCAYNIEEDGNGGDVNDVQTFLKENPAVDREPNNLNAIL